LKTKGVPWSGQGSLAAENECLVQHNYSFVDGNRCSKTIMIIWASSNDSF